MWRCILHEHLMSTESRRQSTLRSGCEPQNNNAAQSVGQSVLIRTVLTKLLKNLKAAPLQALDGCESVGSSAAQARNSQSHVILYAKYL